MGNVKVQKRKVQFRIRKKNRKKIRDKGHEKKKKRVFTDTEKLLKEMDLGKIRLVGGRIICPSSFGQVLKAVPKDDLYTY